MKKVYLFTSSFPYGSGEQFLETEITYLASNFDRVIIIPATTNTVKRIRSLPENVEVRDTTLENRFVRFFTLGYFKLIFNFSNIKVLFKYFLRAITSNQFAFFFSAVNIAANMLQNKVVNEVSKDNEAIVYFYWGHGQAFMLPFIQFSASKVVMRLHRADLYEYLTEDYYPFRVEQLRRVDKVVSISQDGIDYLTKKYPMYKDKYCLSRLGVLARESCVEDDGSQEFNIVTCSSLIPVKRVKRLCEALKLLNVDRKISWHHFGDGPLRGELLESANGLPISIELIFHGHIENSQLLKFYSKTRVDLFVNVSESEGVPVSIMEAISFGIPVVATDVGGSSEIVGRSVGVLLDKDFSNFELSHVIKEFYIGEKQFNSDEVMDFWAQHYDADKNYKEFCREMLGNA